MTDHCISYHTGYKYQLTADYRIATSIKPKQAIDGRFIALDESGELTVKSGYAWDGVSGPVLDTEQNLRASLVHDAFYQLMRKRELSAKTWRDKADKLFRDMCREDGVPSSVARAYYEVLKRLGKPSADPKNAKETLRAPRRQG